MNAARDEALQAILANLRSALDRWYSGDPYGYSDLLDEPFTYYDPFMNDRLETSAQLRAHYATLEGKVNLPRYEIVDPKIELEDGFGVLTYFLKQYSNDGPVGPTWKTTEIYRGGGSRWRMIHAHWSTIPPAS